MMNEIRQGISPAIFQCLGESIHGQLISQISAKLPTDAFSAEEI
jgi:hypothetical protein